MSNNPKMHQDHVASCLCCRYFDLSSATPAYSDVTPEEPASMDCRWHIFGFTYNPDGDALHKILPLAQTCDKFEGRQ